MRGWPVLVLVACGKDEEDPLGPDYSAYPLAADIVIDKVSWYQGVEKVLYLGPSVFGGGVRPPPILSGRDAMVRVAVSAFDEEDPKARDVAVVLNREGGAWDRKRSVVVNSAAWDDADLGTTATFPIPGEFVTDDMKLTVSVHELTTTPTQGYLDETIWRSEDEGLDLEPAEVERLVIIPIRYTGDGSSRVPDTSAARIAEIQDAYLGMYPVKDVEIVVEAPMAWGNAIGAFTGWDTLLMEISSMREAANVPESTYYYAMFDPAPTLDEYCPLGCILGLSLLSPNPADTWARASIGVGYDSEAVSTLVHEVGHAHGREHAPCSLYGQPSDPGYPYPNARLGTWGFDIVTWQLVDPGASADMMSYCAPQWVSDYTFSALHDRMTALRARSGGPKVEWQRLLVSADGGAVPHGTIRAGAQPGGEVRGFDVLADDGALIERIDGWFLPFDHLPGGVALVPPLDGRAVRARLH